MGITLACGAVGYELTSSPQESQPSACFGANSSTLGAHTPRSQPGHRDEVGLERSMIELSVGGWFRCVVSSPGTHILGRGTMTIDLQGKDRHELAKDLGGGLPGLEPQYMMTIANQCVDEVSEKLDALAGAISAASATSTGLGERMRFLTCALFIATGVGAAATVVLAIAAFR